MTYNVQRVTSLEPKKLLKILVPILLLSVFVPLYQAQAQEFGIWSKISCMVSPIECTLNFIRSAFGVLIGVVGTMLDPALHIEVSDVRVVRESWDLSRNFANMFFIVALIIMAFATIFSISKYDFRTLVVKFLIAALLINFSLVIGEIIIDWSQSLSNIFLGAIGSVGDRLGQGTNVGQHFETQLQTINTVEWGIFQGTIAVLANIILLSILLFSMVVLLFFSLVRIPILWALLIVAPLAWILFILPTTQKWSKMWWDYFIGWNLFMPIYLFFIYFGVLFLNKQQEILASTSTPSIIPGLGTTNILQVVFFYILVGLFLIWGAKAALQLSHASGAGVVAGWAYGRGAVMRRAAWKATGVPGAYKEAKEHIQKEGVAGIPLVEKIPIIGRYRGQRGLEKRQAAIAGALGMPGVAEKQLNRGVDVEIKRIKEKGTHLNKTSLETILRTGSPEQKIAAAQVWAEENYGALSPDLITGLRSAFGKNVNTSLAASVFRKQKWGEMSADQLREFLDPANANHIDDPSGNMQSIIYNALIEKGRATTDEIQKALGLARSDGQRSGIIKKAGDILKNAASEDQRLELFRGIGTGDNETKREMLKLVADTGDKFFLQDEHGADISADLIKRRERLKKLTEDALSEPERRKFLEGVSEKYALDAANVMVDLGLLKDVKTGAQITRATHSNAEDLALDQVHSKLSIEKKLSQHQSQYAVGAYQQALGRDMAKNIHGYAGHDKYALVQPKIIEAQRAARHSVFLQEHFQPFNAQVKQLYDRIKDLRTHPPTPQALNSIKQQLQNTMLRKLVDIRNDYERLCIKENLMTDPIDKAGVEADLKKADLIINTYTSRIANL